MASAHARRRPRVRAELSRPPPLRQLVYMAGATLLSALAVFTMSIELKPEAPEEEEAAPKKR